MGSSICAGLADFGRAAVDRPDKTFRKFGLEHVAGVVRASLGRLGLPTARWLHIRRTIGAVRPCVGVSLLGTRSEGGL